MTTHIQRSALLPYPAQALYDLVNDVAKYPEFLPWCSSAEIIESTEVLMRARLGVAKGGLSQHFVTRNVLVPGETLLGRDDDQTAPVFLLRSLNERVARNLARGAFRQVDHVIGTASR